MPETFHPRLLLSVDPSNHFSHLGLHTTFQTVISSITSFVVPGIMEHSYSPIRHKNIRLNKTFKCKILTVLEDTKI